MTTVSSGTTWTSDSPSGRGNPESFIVNSDVLPYNILGLVLNVSIHSADILAKDANDEKLNSGEGGKEYYDGGKAGHAEPIQEISNKVEQR